MELSTQIKKYRTSMNLSQEELAEKVYVTRQTISNWENSKSYPDIHSLLLLSSLFNISLDQLIKGDIDIMRKEINQTEIQKFNHYGTIFTLLLILFVVSIIPLTIFLGYYGLLISAVLYVIVMYLAIKIEKMKKDNNLQTFKDIVAFTDGKKLDEIENLKNMGSYIVKILPALAIGIAAFFIGMFLVWLLKSFVF